MFKSTRNFALNLLAFLCCKFSYIVISLSLCILFCCIAEAAFGQTNIYTLKPHETVQHIQSHIEICQNCAAELTYEEAQKRHFQAMSSLSFQTNRYYWLKISLSNPSSSTDRWYLHLDNWSYIQVLSATQKQQSGHLVSFLERSYPHHLSYLPLDLQAHHTEVFFVRVYQEMAFYLPSLMKATLLKEEFVQKQNQQRLLFQGFFLGVIVVMALYNLLIYWSVRDLSFLYYVISLVGVGLYFLFYYGFTLEWLWGNYPQWNAYSFALIVPLTRMTWIVFTQNYLHLKEILPFWYQVLNGLIVLYAVPILLGGISFVGFYDFSVLTVNWIGVMGVVVLSMIILMGVLSLRQGYKPAFYFVAANLIFSIGSILFIFRETGWLPDTFWTRYAAQIGILIQVVLFSLGLADRLNTIRQQLAQKALENERLEREKETQRKALLEDQKRQLAFEVAQRTADLEEKTHELEITIQKLSASEHNLRELNHIKDRFFSIISHDLRSPLATLNSFLNILLNYSDSFSKDELQKLADKTQQSVKNLSFLLDNLLQWAMSQMSQTRFNPIPLNLSEVATETIELLTVIAEEKKIDLRMDISSDLIVFADSNMLSFVLRNLLINAIKFTEKPAPVWIKAERKEAKIVVYIIDQGQGIAPENLSKLLITHQYFTTLGTVNEKGIGLGLMLCKEFVEKNGGTLSVVSELGKGSTFSFDLPCTEELFLEIG